MGKRGNSEGSLYQRKDGRWVASYFATDGRRRSLYADTRQAVSRKLTDALKARADGLPAPSARLAVGSFFANWLVASKTTVKESTWIRYRQLLTAHAIPYVGRLPLTRLEPSHLQRLYAERLASGLSPATVAHLHRVVHRALTDATRWGHVIRNVASLVSPPRVPRRQVLTLTSDEARALLRAAKGERLEALYTLALTTGLRQGEIFALTWGDVDLEVGNVSVQRTVSWLYNGPVVTEAKTNRSRRRVVLTPDCLEAMKKHRASQATERLKLGADWQDRGLVFANEVGGYLHPGNFVTRNFKPLLTRAGLPTFNFHRLRHTAATLLLSRNVHPKVVSEMLGHSTVGVTLDVYSHVLPDMQREASETMQRLLGSDS